MSALGGPRDSVPGVGWILARLLPIVPAGPPSRAAHALLALDIRIGEFARH